MRACVLIANTLDKYLMHLMSHSQDANNSFISNDDAQLFSIVLVVLSSILRQIFENEMLKPEK